MRFPSFVSLTDRAREVLVRFPWTLLAGVVTAAAAIAATTKSADPHWARLAMVAGLALPLTVALTLFAEERSWSAGRAALLNAVGLVLLALFYTVWPGPERKHEAIRYFQLNAGLHLLVAVLPFGRRRETRAFWQYNRRLFLGFLRANVFSGVLFVGLAIALGALDKLFGVPVPQSLYARLWLVNLFVVTTWIFLTDVPRDLTSLVDDTSYPRVLKLFAQYILTPLVFIYLLILLAYLVKIVIGGEWPSGWIGWLVTSVAITGLLGFLLVHPLRDDPEEGWIRTYTRWVFIGLIPAAVVLLVAFWKRVLPYGLTELRLLGVLLGVWLLAIAVSYTVRSDAGIKRIPVTLALLLLLTLYGPFSITSISVASQGRRLAGIVSGPREGRRTDGEASGALLFLLEHGARRQIAAAMPKALPQVNWDSIPDKADQRDSAAVGILATAGLTYLPRWSAELGQYVSLWAQGDVATAIGGYDWMVNLARDGKQPIRVGSDTVGVNFDSTAGVLRLTLATDSFNFDLQRLAGSVAGIAARTRTGLPPDRLRLYATAPARKAMLALEMLSGRRVADSLRVEHWSGKLFLGPAD